jgi:hypothetical protein
LLLVCMCKHACELSSEPHIRASYQGALSLAADKRLPLAMHRLSCTCTCAHCTKACSVLHCLVDQGVWWNQLEPSAVPKLCLMPLGLVVCIGRAAHACKTFRTLSRIIRLNVPARLVTILRQQKPVEVHLCHKCC